MSINLQFLTLFLQRYLNTRSKGKIRSLFKVSFFKCCTLKTILLPLNLQRENTQTWKAIALTSKSTLLIKVQRGTASTHPYSILIRHSVTNRAAPWSVLCFSHFKNFYNNIMAFFENALNKFVICCTLLFIQTKV